MFIQTNPVEKDYIPLATLYAILVTTSSHSSNKQVRWYFKVIHKLTGLILLIQSYEMKFVVW